MRFLAPLLVAILLLAGLPARAATYQPAPEEQAFLALFDAGRKPLEAREAAQAYLAGHPQSFLAHLVIGVVDLRRDGDLPRALYHLTEARTLMERQYPVPWADPGPWKFYAFTLIQLYWTDLGMERYRDALEALDTQQHHFLPKRTALYGWPLLKLGRTEEARRRCEEALRLKDPAQQEDALNTLGAIESEADHPQRAYDLSLRLYTLLHQPGHTPNCTALRNHAEDALMLGRADEAERVFLESAGFWTPVSTSNPWQDLAALYLDEQRLPEALDAVRRMQTAGFRSVPLIGLENRNRRQSLTAGLLWACGYTDEALAIAWRLAELPDRHGLSSTQNALWTAGSLFLYEQVLQDALARDAEALSCAPWRARPRLWLQRIRHAGASMLVERRIARILMGHPGWLDSTLRELSPADPVLVPGGEILLADCVGPGPVEAEARRLLARQGAAAGRERGFVLLQLGAALEAKGDAAQALPVLIQAEQALPGDRAMERTQALALKARVQIRLGDRAGALASLQGLMARDPGAVRRFGLRLPCRIEAGGGPAARQAASWLDDSPRLDPAQAGFRLALSDTGSGLQGILSGPSGDILSRVRVPRGPDPQATAQAFCQAFHRQAFGPHIDLSQEQIHSLSGSTLQAEDMNQQLKDLLGTDATGTVHPESDH